MSVDKFNSEGYYDPTAYEAMSTVEKEERALRAFRPIVYICSPYAGEIEKKVGYVMWPIRTAVSGKQSTPGGATELMEILGKEESIARIKAAIEKLSE